MKVSCVCSPLSVPVVKLPLASLRDLAESDTYRLLVLGGSSHHLLLQVRTEFVSQGQGFWSGKGGRHHMW